ncbi:MAG: hypothetical protein EOO39_04955, partial [Cytophagaceae bacterium]
MQTRFLVASIIAVFSSVNAFAQIEKPHLTKEERVARREEVRAKLAAMTPEERKAFKETQRVVSLLEKYGLPTYVSFDKQQV